MTIYDLLTNNLAILRRFHRNGVATDSIRFLPMFEDWKRMSEKGYKKQYTEEVIAQKYGYSPRYVRMVVKYMSEKVV